MVQCCGLLLCPEHLHSDLESQGLAEACRDLHPFPQRPHVHSPLPLHSDVLRLDRAWTPLVLGLLWEAMIGSWGSQHHTGASLAEMYCTRTVGRTGAGDIGSYSGCFHNFGTHPESYGDFVTLPLWVMNNRPQISSAAHKLHWEIITGQKPKDNITLQSSNTLQCHSILSNIHLCFRCCELTMSFCELFFFFKPH